MLQISCKSEQIFRSTETIPNDGSSIEIIDLSHGYQAVACILFGFRDFFRSLKSHFPFEFLTQYENGLIEIFYLL